MSCKTNTQKQRKKKERKKNVKNVKKKKNDSWNGKETNRREIVVDGCKTDLTL